MTTPKVLLKRSSVVGKVPTTGDLDYGELAINFADGKIYYKNSSNQIVAFIDSARTQALIDAVNQTAENQLDSAEVIALIDSAYVQARQSYDALTLGGDSGDYYRNYNNLFNKPLILDIVDVQNIIDARVNQTFVDNLNIDADTLDGLNSTQFLRSDSDTRLTADLIIDSNLTVGGDATFNSDVTLSGNLYGPATMFIDPAVHDSDTGKVVIRGDLQVDGTQTIVNSTTVSINDKNIILADSAADSAEADGAGITVNGANATITYNAAEDEWQFNKKVQSPNLEVTNVIDATTVNTTNITSTNINTTNITGNYTNFDSDFDSALGTKTTTNLTEGDNLYYTTARADSDARSALTARKVSGFGDLTYDSSVGKFSYTGVSTQEIRDQFAAQGDLSYDSATGVFSIDVETVYTKANFDSDLGAASTDDLPEGTTNLYYTTTRHDSDFDVRFALKTTDDLTEGNTNLYYTTARNDSDTRVLVDSAYIKNNTDSSFIENIINNSTSVFVNNIDSAYVRARVRTDQDLRTTDSVTFAGVRISANSVVFGESDATMTYLPDSDMIEFNKPVKGEQVQFTGATIQSDSGTFNGLYVYDNRRGQKDWVSRFSRRQNEYSSPAVVLISSDAEARSDLALEIRGNANSNLLGPEFDDKFHDDSNTTFAVYASGHTLIGYSNLPGGVGALYPYSMLSGDNNVRLQVKHGISVDSNIVFHAGNYTSYIDSAYVQARMDGVDSAAIIQLVDSAYVQQRVSFETSGYGGLKLMSASTDNTANTLTWTFDTDDQAENFRELVHGTTQPANSVGTRLFFYDADGYWYRIGASGSSKSVVRRYQVTRTNNVAVVEFDSSQDDMLTSTSNPSGFPVAGVDLIQLRNINDPTNPGTFGDPYELGETIQSADISSGYYGESAQVFGVLSSTTFNTTVSTIITTDVDSAYVQLHAKGLDYNVLSNKPALIDSTLVTQLIDSAYIKLNTDSAFIENIINNSTTVFENNVDSAYVQLHAIGLDYNVLSNKPNILDSSDIVGIIVSETLDSDLIINLVDSAYIQLRDRFQDSAGVKAVIDSAYVESRRPAETIFNVVNSGSSAYTFSGDGFSSSRNNPTLYLTRGKTYKFNLAVSGHPFQIRVSNGGAGYNTGVTNNGAQSGAVIFTPDMNAPTYLVYQCTLHGGMVGDIIITDDAYIDSNQAINLIDSAYVRARVRTDQDLRTTDSVTFGGLTVTDNRIYWGESNATMEYLPDSDKIFFNKPIKVDAEATFTSTTIGTDSGTFTGLYVYDARLNSMYNRDWVARFSRLKNEAHSAATVLISNDAEERSDIAFEVRGNVYGDQVDDQTSFRDDDDTKFVIFGSGHTLIGYSNMPNYSRYEMLSGDNNIKLQVNYGIAVDSNIVFHAGNYTSYIDSAYINARVDSSSGGGGGGGTVDSADIVTIVDSAYIEARRPAESVFNVTNNGAGAYTFSGDGFSSSRDNPKLFLLRGKTYKFSVNATGHPFEIRLSDGGSAYSTGVTNNGAQVGDVLFTPDMNAPSSLVYQCQNHAAMLGDIVIGFDSATITNLVDSAYVQARQSAGGGGGSGTLDSNNIDTVIDSAYVKARVDHNANEVLIFGDDQQVAGTPAQSNTSVVSFFNAIYPDGQFIASYNYASGGLPIGQWLYAYYWVNSGHGYFQVVSKTDLGNGTYRYYCQDANGNAAPNWAGGWTNYVVLASIQGATEKALRISHQSNGDYIFFDGRRNFFFSQNDSDQRNFKIELNGTSALEMVGGKHIHYGNSYDSDGDFPSASIYKGMVAHAKNNDALYYANDSGIWTTIAGTGAQAFQDSAVVLGLIDSDYILGKKFVPGDAERRWNITSAAPTGPQQVSTGDFWLDRDDLNLYRLTADGNWTSSLPAGTFSAEAGLTSNNVFQNGGGTNSSFNIGSSHTPPGPNGTFSSTFTISTSPYNSGGRWTFTNPVNFGYYYMGNSDAGHLWSIGYTDGSYMVANGGLGGSKTATPSSYTWYDAQGNSLGKTINQGNSGGHTHDVRHPNGVLATYIIHGRNNYGTRNYDAWMFFSGANDWVRVGEIYDSGDIKNLIDSAYISGLGITGTDSSTVQGLIDASLDSAALPFSQTFLHYTSDSGQKVYSGFDDDSETLSYTVGALAVYLNGILLIDSVDFTATDGSTITLTDSASLGDILTVQKFSGNSQTAATQAIIDSNFLNVGSNLIPALDSTYDLGSPTKKWKDLYLSGNSIYLGGHQIHTDGNNIRFIDSNGNNVGLQANNLLDSANVVSIIGSETLDSALIVNLVDSAYIQLRDRFQDSSGITAVVDSAYVRQRVTRSDLDMLGNKVLFGNVYDSTGSFPSASTYHGMFAHAHNTGAGYFAHAGAWTRLANHSDLNSYSDSDVLVLVDSAYVQARQTTGGSGTVDSADIIAIVDSAYVQARQSAGGGSGTVDSAQTISLIEATVDSDYIGTKVDFTRGEFANEKSQYTATAAQTVFNHSSIDPTHLDVYLNGVLQVVNDDYTATSSAVTFSSGVDSGYSVTIVEKRGRVLTQRGLVERKYYFTTSTPTVSITGADDNGITLDYSVGNLDVYLNGMLLKDSDDYSTNGGTTVTLVSATDSNDLVTLVNRKGVVVTPNVKNYEYTATAGQLTFSGADINSQTLAYVPDAVQVYLNGILLRNVDYTAINGTSITLTDSAALNDELVVSAFSSPGQNMDLYKFTADSGQTIFNGNDLTGASLAYNPGNIQVFMNGLLLNDSDDYTASNGMSVVLTSGADASDEIKIASFVSNTTTLRTNAWSAPTGTPVTAAAGDKLFIDTSSPKTVTLPSSASMGDEIRIIDVTGNAATNNITVDRNGHSIQGSASNLTININRAGIGLVYYNSAQGWVLIEN